MNEKEFFQRVILDRAVNDTTVMKNAAYQQKNTVAWRRTAAIAALCFAALIGAVFLIPSARAEVLSWFGVSTPQDYLSAEPGERPDVPELGALVASPDAAEALVTIPIDRTESKAINSKSVQKVSEFFYENCDITLGDAMFDGTNIYQSIHFSGLSGLYLLENFTGGTVTRVEIDPEALTGTYAPDSEPSVSAMGRPEGYVIYELADGTCIKGWVEEPYNASVEAYLNALNQKGILLMPSSAERTLTVEESNRAFLEENGLTATAQVWIYDPAMVEPLLDEGGNLTADVYYLVNVVEEDRGDGSDAPETELFRAKLGTITVNMRSYRNLEQRQVEPAETSVAWADESILLSKFTVEDERITFSRQQAQMNGVTLSADAQNTTVDALGIRDVCVRIEMPASWTQEQCEALIASLSFQVLIDGEEGDWFAQACRFEEQSDGSVLFRSERIEGVPYTQLRTIKTVTLIPVLQVVDSLELLDHDGNPVGVLNPAVGETAWSEAGNRIGSGLYETTAFPQYAITLVIG